MQEKKLDRNFNEVDNWRDARYRICESGDVELLWDAEAAYFVINGQAILKLAEILKKGSREEQI